jgi:anti-sigma regulatory factor (Ser/Thr protein kinase)
LLKLDLPPLPSSASRARSAVREYLDSSCPGEVVETTALLVTELVTNAVLHAGTQIVVVVDHAPGSFKVRVCDNSDVRLVARPLEPTAATGRGLLLVQQLATTWGVNSSQRGKEVWCEIQFPDRARGVDSG